MKKIPFTKMHGCGNDYIYVNTMLHDVPNPSESAILWSDRHKGIGSDGLVLIGRSGIPEADFSMRIFNADGSEAMMCGNASRCIGKYLYERGFLGKKVVDGRDAAGAESPAIRLLTRSGIKTLWLDVSEGIVERVTVDMLEPILEDHNQFLDSCGLDKGTFVSMGNPHYVIFTDDVDQVGETGRMLEHHPAFPQRCNIEFVRVEDDGTLRTRVWERGSGITQACGTGACATAVAAVLTGRANRLSQVAMDGGTLSIEWCENDHISNGRYFQENHVYMTGPATFVYDGEIEPINIS